MLARSFLIASLIGLTPLVPRLTQAQDRPVVGQDTILPGSGPGTSVTGQGGGQLMEASSADAAAKRQGLKPVAFLASKMIGVEVRNTAGENVGKIEDLLVVNGGTLKAVVIEVGGFLGVGSRQIAVEPSAVVLRPGGDRFSAVLDMGKDTIAAAVTFKPDQALKAQ